MTLQVSGERLVGAQRRARETVNALQVTRGLLMYANGLSCRGSSSGSCVRRYCGYFMRTSPFCRSEVHSASKRKKKKKERKKDFKTPNRQAQRHSRAACVRF